MGRKGRNTPTIGIYQDEDVIITRECLKIAKSYQDHGWSVTNYLSQITGGNRYVATALANGLYNLKVIDKNDIWEADWLQ